MKSKRLARALSFLLLLVFLLPVCSSCQHDGNPAQDLKDLVLGKLPGWIATTAQNPATSVPTATSAPVTTAPPPVTTLPVTTAQPTGKIVYEAGERKITESQLSDFLCLVRYEDVLTAEMYFENYFIGTFRTVDEACSDIFLIAMENFYIENITDPEDATEIFINCYLESMDEEFGVYYAPKNATSFYEDSEGEYYGIGVSVTQNEDGYLDVLLVFPDSPAEKAGILPGDLLVGVGGDDIAKVGYQPTIDRIRGELGTTVNLTYERDGARYEVSVGRDKVTEITAEGRMIGDDIGYIRITSFDEKTYEQFVNTYLELEQAGARAWVFDLRNDPGGSLSSVVAMAEFVLPDGPIVHLTYKDVQYTYNSIYDCYPKYMLGKTYYRNHKTEAPVVVLTNGNTASAAELFTSSLRDYGICYVIGTTTYGKGVGQNIFGFSDGSVLLVTSFSYDPPTSPNYHKIGIVPDETVELPGTAARKHVYRLTAEEDTQLAAAIAYLTE